MNVYKDNLFPKIQEAKVIYDAYMELLPKCFWSFGIKKNIDFCVDMYGSKQLELFENENWFSIKECVCPIEQYGIDLVPIENNIIYGLKGKELSFSRRIYYKNFNKKAFKDSYGNKNILLRYLLKILRKIKMIIF